jgi:mannose-1-phosphate guanylyltransferase
MTTMQARVYIVAGDHYWSSGYFAETLSLTTSAAHNLMQWLLVSLLAAVTGITGNSDQLRPAQQHLFSTASQS